MQVPERYDAIQSTTGKKHADHAINAGSARR